jgi:hypothetical protein
MLVLYESELEVIVTTVENEKQVVYDYFTVGDRNLDDYDRIVVRTVRYRPALITDNEEI